jgi:class 3 adenylate cyclase
VIKTIGDAVMIRHSDPSQAVVLGLTAAHEVIAGHGSPAVRVGMHHGPAIERSGDWFGATVNLAARVATLAARGEVLLTGAVRDGAGELEGVEFETPRRAADPQRGRPRPPIRGRERQPQQRGAPPRPATRSTGLCSLECARRFLRDQDAYAPGERGA